METLIGTSFMTFATDGDTKKITYETAHAVNILNGTNDEIYINTTNDFDTGTHFVIPAGCSYNDLHIGVVTGAELYIKSVGAGKISVVCGRY